ncbi:hypothetical protein BC827DRAFT_1270393 [Russula dissimulans]|nr:hypothetical protein BC827DRAFT_1270393 [Russula dissimulans]
MEMNTKRGNKGEEVEEEGEEADKPEEEEEEEEPADGAATQCRSQIWMKFLRPQSPRCQPQKPSRVPRAFHNNKDLDSDIKLEDNNKDDRPRGGDGKLPPTTRQAVLASVIGSSHISLEETAELALRREETARKRKHLSEKRLENEKAETINCLRGTR